jgi:hypothetical protein
VRRKYYRGQCHNCDELRKLVLSEKDEDQGLIRLRCSECAAFNEFQLDWVLKNGRVLTPEEYEDREEALSEVQVYNPQNSYWRGQKIEHPVLEEVGNIVAKSETSEGNKFIVVNFEKSGKRKLVEDYALDTQF